MSYMSGFMWDKAGLVFTAVTKAAEEEKQRKIWEICENWWVKVVTQHKVSIAERQEEKEKKKFVFICPGGMSSFSGFVG